MNTILLILYILMFVAFVRCNAIGINLPIKNAKNKTRSMIISIILILVGMVGAFLWGFYFNDVIKILGF